MRLSIKYVCLLKIIVNDAVRNLTFKVLFIDTEFYLMWNMALGKCPLIL
jgi:hypothetical protein